MYDHFSKFSIVFSTVAGDALLLAGIYTIISRVVPSQVSSRSSSGRLKKRTYTLFKKEKQVKRYKKHSFFFFFFFLAYGVRNKF